MAGWTDVFSSVGAGGPISAGIGAVGSLVGGLFQQNANKKMMREAMRHQTSEREASQAFQTSEREAAQGFQTSEREAQNQYSEDMYNQYSSPAAMARQYVEAGLNPRLAADGSSAGGVTAGAGSSGAGSAGGAPSGGSIAAPYQDSNVWSRGFQDMAAAVSALADARKKGADALTVESLRSDLVKQYKLQNVGQEIANSMDMQRYSYLKPNLQADLMQKLQALESGKISISQAKETLETLRINKLIASKDYDTYMDRFNKDMAVADSQIDLNKANAADARSHVGVNNAEVSLKRAQEGLAKLMQETEKLKPDQIKSIKRLNDSISSINEVKAEIANSTKEREKIVLQDELYRRQQAARNELSQLIREGDILDAPIIGDIYTGLGLGRKLLSF